MSRLKWEVLERWFKFNFVGAIGIGVQLAMLWALTRLGFAYLAATALAVEAAVLHNFMWHERFTWKDRRTAEPLSRLGRFNFTTGAVSIIGNLILMRFFVGGVHLRPMTANLVSIAACSLLNYFVSDRWVFRMIARAQ